VNERQDAGLKLFDLAGIEVRENVFRKGAFNRQENLKILAGFPDSLRDINYAVFYLACIA